MTHKEQKPLKVLWITTWYPHPENPVSGVFTRQQAEAVSDFCDVAVLALLENDLNKTAPLPLSCSKENKLTVFRKYHPPIFKKNIGFLSGITTTLQYFSISYKAYKEVKKAWGAPKIIHINNAFPLGILTIALYFCFRIPYIITEHYDIYIRIEKKIQNVGKMWLLLTKIITRLAKRVIVDSHASLKAMLKLGLKTNYEVIPCVIETYPEKTQTNTKNSKKKAIHISLLTEQQKNISGLIKTFHQIGLTRQDFELHLIGDGPERTTHEKLAKELNLLNSSVFFHGRTSEEQKWELLYNSDFHVLFSNYEGFSVVTAEAISAGIPVIATKCGGPEDFVTEEVGILIESKNQEQLKTAIEYLLNNSQKFQKQKLKDYAKQRFNAQLIGKSISTIYSKILKK